MEWANDLAMAAAANLPDESLHRETVNRLDLLPATLDLAEISRGPIVR
jgi:hypothetical protein